MGLGKNRVLAIQRVLMSLMRESLSKSPIYSVFQSAHALDFTRISADTNSLIAGLGCGSTLTKQ